MLDSDWIKLLLTFLVGFLTNAFAQSFRAWLTRPKVGLQFIPKVGLGHGYISSTRERLGDLQFRAFYIRASATNLCRTTAKSCRVFLTRIERQVESGDYTVLHHDALPLPWAYIGAVTQDIPPKMSFFFDVFQVSECDPRFVPSTTIQPLTWNDQLRDKGKFRLSVLLTGENLEPVQFSISFDWKGSFDDFAVAISSIKMRVL